MIRSPLIHPNFRPGTSFRSSKCWVELNSWGFPPGLSLCEVLWVYQALPGIPCVVFGPGNPDRWIALLDPWMIHGFVRMKRNSLRNHQPCWLQSIIYCMCVLETSVWSLDACILPAAISCWMKKLKFKSPNSRLQTRLEWGCDTYSYWS